MSGEVWVLGDPQFYLVLYLQMGFCRDRFAFPDKTKVMAVKYKKLENIKPKLNFNYDRDDPTGLCKDWVDRIARGFLAQPKASDVLWQSQLFDTKGGKEGSEESLSSFKDRTLAKHLVSL